MATLIKYSTHDCCACQATAVYDSRIAAELGLSFIDVDLHNADIYRSYRPILLQQYPLKKNLYLPTYILVSDPEGDFQIHGEITGGPAEDALRSLLTDLICKLPPEEQRQTNSARQEQYD